MGFGQDQNGIFKPLPDGRVLRVTKRTFNTILTLSSSQQDDGWKDGW
jgi:hypothetical protein